MKKIGVLFIFALSIMGVACEKEVLLNGSDAKMLGIIGGFAEKNGSELARMAVSLRDPKSREPFCTATILAPRLLLTAAHCVLGLEPEKIQATFDVNGMNPRAVTRGAKKIWPHEGFQSAMEECPSDEVHLDCVGKSQIALVGTRNDLALILLKEDIPVGYDPVRLATDQSWRAFLPKVKLAGYGINTPLKKFNRESSKQISANAGTLRSLDLGADVFMEKTDISEKYQTILVKSDGKSGMCSGDSGGPLFIHDAIGWLQAGVSSYLFDGDEAMPCGFVYTSYTDLSRHADWIQSTTRKILNGESPSISHAAVGLSLNHPRMLETTDLTMKMTCATQGKDVLDVVAQTEGSHLISMLIHSGFKGVVIHEGSNAKWTESQSSINLSHDVFGADEIWESSGDRGALLKALFNHQPVGLTIGDFETWGVSVNEETEALFDVTSFSPTEVVLMSNNVHVKLKKGAVNSSQSMACKAVLTIQNPMFWP